MYPSDIHGLTHLLKQLQLYRNAWGPVNGRPTNNVAEIEAATHAIEIAQEYGIGEFLIRTDSQFLIDAYYKYMDNWVQNGWRLYDGRPVKNAEQFKELDRVIRRDPHMELEFEFVRGHSGDEYNMEADRLAKMGARGDRSY